MIYDAFEMSLFWYSNIQKLSLICCLQSRSEVNFAKYKPINKIQKCHWKSHIFIGAVETLDRKVILSVSGATEFGILLGRELRRRSSRAAWIGTPLPDVCWISTMVTRPCHTSNHTLESCNLLGSSQWGCHSFLQVRFQQDDLFYHRWMCDVI